ncbi:MAG: hydrogenase iron-sulfur subunit [Desulfatiglandaceae bacterium]|jgi:quinone-modifying oxidoreductase, subunit QmoB
MKGLPPQKCVVVLGDGETACQLSERLVKEGFPVLLLFTETRANVKIPEGPECLRGARVVSMTGQVGDFTLALDLEDERIERSIGFAVIAYESVREPVYDILGEPGHERVWTLSRAEAAIEETGPPPGVKRVILLDRLDGLNTTAGSERLLSLIAHLQEEYEIACCLITCQVKVASMGLEMLYGRVRDGGCFVARTDLLAVGLEPGAVKVRFDDVVLDEDLNTSADLLVVGESERPAPVLQQLGTAFGLETGPGGYLQSDNLLRSTCLTNRRGVLVANGSACGMNAWESSQSISAVVEEISGLSKWIVDQGPVEQILYDRDLCATCLTCFRVCPHGAIHFTDKPHFFPLACQRCGICTSLCPGEAIELSGAEKFLYQSRIFPEENGKGESPRITGFVCQRSADLVRRNGHENDSVLGGVNWVEVPCAGTLRTQYLLELLGRRQGADGVVVVSCHRDNCRSGDGTVRAVDMVHRVKGLLKTLEMDERVVTHIPLAPNEGNRLRREIALFREELNLKS